MDKLRLSLGALIVVGTFILIAQNQEVVSTHVFLWTLETPRFLLLGGMFVVGGLAGYLVGSRTRISR